MPQQTVIAQATGATAIDPKEHYPTAGALLTYYAQALQNQERVPEDIWTWAAENTGSDALDVGFYSGLRRVFVHWRDVSFSYNGLGVRSSVRGNLNF
jgi:hypothetical protein